MKILSRVKSETQTELVTFNTYPEGPASDPTKNKKCPLSIQHSKEEKVSRTCKTGVKVHYSESSVFVFSDKHNLLSSDYLRPEKDNAHPTYKVRFGHNR